MMSQTGEQIIAIRILFSISRSKKNQVIEFTQLIKCKKRNIFLEESYTKCGGEASPSSFHKKSYLWISILKCCKVSFYCMSKPSSVVYNLGVLLHFATWGIFGLGSLSTFWIQKSGKENSHNSKRFSTISSFYV